MNLPPLDRRLLRRSGEELTEFISRLERTANDADSSSSEAFAELMKQATQDFDLDEMIIAARFGVDGDTIHRWASGKFAPPIRARQIVLKWLQDRLESELQANSGREFVAG